MTIILASNASVVNSPACEGGGTILTSASLESDLGSSWVEPISMSLCDHLPWSSVLTCMLSFNQLQCHFPFRVACLSATRGVSQKNTISSKQSYRNINMCVHNKTVRVQQFDIELQRIEQLNLWNNIPDNKNL